MTYRYILYRGYKGSDFQSICNISERGGHYEQLYLMLRSKPYINDLSWVCDDGTCYVVKREECKGGD